MANPGRMDAPERPRFGASLQGRLLLAALAVLAPLLVGGGLWLILVSRSSDSYKELVRESMDESEHSVALMRQLNLAEDSGHLYLESGDPTRLGIFQTAAAGVDRTLRNPGVYDQPGEVLGLLSIRQPWELAERQVESYRPRPGVDPDPRVHEFLFQMGRATAGVSRLMGGFQREVISDVTATERDARLNWLIGAVALALALALVGFLVHRLSGALLRPLKKLTLAARALSAGHLGHRVEVESAAELNEVGAAFNTMAAALSD
jgi:HAMP domain-containing protein